MNDESLLNMQIDGRFQIEEVLGGGGMGTVYLARHLVLERPFALKVIHRELIKDDQIAQMFRREARAASRIQHPNVTYVFDFSQTEDGRPFLVMEYVEGTTLEQRLKELRREGKQLEVPRALSYLIQIADALDAAHECDVVHRDLKPSNIALTTRDRLGEPLVKVLDFGLAKILGVDSFDSLSSKSVFGTPEYMSPEQYIARHLIDHRSDIYALGAVAFEILCGAPPFRGRPMKVLLAHRETDPPVPSQVAGRADLSEGLDAIILRCLAKDPDSRYQSAADLAMELRGLQGRLSRAPATDRSTRAYEHAAFASTLPVGRRAAAGLQAAQTQGARTAPLASTLPLGYEVPKPVNLGSARAVDELVQLLQERGLGRPRLVRLLASKIEAEDAVLQAGGEIELLRTRSVQLALGLHRREARLRSALVLLERAAARWSDLSIPEHARKVAEQIRALSREHTAQKQELERQLADRQGALASLREEADCQRALLADELASTKRESGTQDEELLALFSAAGL